MNRSGGKGIGVALLAALLLAGKRAASAAAANRESWAGNAGGFGGGGASGSWEGDESMRRTAAPDPRYRQAWTAPPRPADAAAPGGPHHYPGPWVWFWPGAGRDGWSSLEPSDALIRELHDHGVVGVIAQDGLFGGLDWLTAERRRAFAAGGIRTAIGLGMDSSDVPAIATPFVRAIVSAYDAAGAVMLNWEGRWNGDSRRALAKAIADGVLAARIEATIGIIDAPWWAPLALPNDHLAHPNHPIHATHPGAPTSEFGRITISRWPQAYGAARARDGETPEGVVGRSERMLAWSRSPTQYATLGVWPVGPSFQMYARTVADQLHAMLRERTWIGWDWKQADAACRLAMRARHALAVLGLEGPNALVEFQRSRQVVPASGQLDTATQRVLFVRHAA